MMTTFKNTKWNGKRDYECTNVVACVAEQTPKDGMEWEPVDESFLFGKTQLWIQAGVRYYGWL